MIRCTLVLSLVAFIMAPALSFGQTSAKTALRAEGRITLDEHSEWEDWEVESLLAGVRALPPKLIDGLDEPIRMRKVAHACLFGVGRYTESCPTYDDEGAFLLYEMPPIQGEGPVERLAPLDVQERKDIQRRRAAVHAVMLAWDWDQKWSRDKQWRRINGWRASKQPFNRDLWGYSRYLGYRSPRLDLVTFAESWFVRPIDVIDPLRQDRIDPNDSVECQEFSKHRFLSEHVAKLDPQWSPNRRHDAPQCPAFEAWARQHAFGSFDLLVAAATADRPESLYGHLLLHLRYEDRAEGFEPVYQFGAVTDTNVAPLTYFSKGLLGGFLSVLDLNTFRSVDRLFMQYEQRNLKRYELRLSPRQERRLLERIWEYERRIRYPYHFFANNCASFLYDLIAPALELDVPNRSRLIVAPTDVLDLLASVDNPGRGPLLRKRPRIDFSSREIAQKGVKTRRDLEPRLTHELNLSPQESRELAAAMREAEQRDATQRRDAYEQIRTLLTASLDRQRNDETLELVIDYLHLSGQIERYFAENAFFRTREIKHAASKSKLTFTAEEILERRRELYRTEDPQKRYETLLSWTEEREKALTEGPFREFTPREIATLNRANEAEEAYLAALDAQAAVIEQFAPKFDGIAYLSAKEDALQRQQAARDALATGPSGKGRVSLGGAGTTPDFETFGGGFVASASFIYERLGEQRRRGFRSDIESRAIGLDLQVPFVERFWENVDLDVTALRFMTIEQKLGPIRRNFLGHFGWGGEAFGGHDGRRGLNFELGLQGGLLIPIFQTDQAANHLAVGLYLDSRVDFGAQGRRILVGGDGFARLLLHLGGVYANSLRLEANSRHWLAAETLSYEWELRGRVSTEHAIAYVGDYPLVLSPWTQLEWTTVDYTGRDEFRDIKAGLSFELPL